MKALYNCGRFIQILSLIVMPFSIWVGFLGHNEQGCIAIFAGSIVFFFIGWILTQIR